MLTPENKSNLKDLLDELIKLGGMWEFISDQFINIGVDLFDSQVLDKHVPKALGAKINEIVAKAHAGEYTEAIEEIGILLDHYINLPWFEGESEETAFQGVALLLKAALMQLLDESEDPA